MLERLLILFFSLLLVYQLFFQSSCVEGYEVNDISLKNHDEIVNIKAELNTKYRPLIVDSEGTPTDLLTRLATLEGDVQALSSNAINNQQNRVESIPEPPDFAE
jgi:hypothetical protein